MILSSFDIKKKIISEILAYPDENNNREMISLKAEINKLIVILDSADSRITKNLSRPNLDAADLKKSKRVLDLAFKRGADLNSLAIDIGESLPKTNRLLQIGIDYLFENIRKKDFKTNGVAATVKSKATNQKKPQKKVNKPVGIFAKLLFLFLLAAGGITIYNILFNTSATKVQTLVQEYRSDQKLASVKRMGGDKIIKIAGSKALIQIANKVKGSFHLKYPGLSVETEELDSGEAINRLLDKKISIAAVSRMPTVDERKKSQRQGTLISDHRVALDAVAVFVHPLSTISRLTLEELKEIFSTDSQNWAHYGAQEAPVERFSSSPESGTHSFFIERVLTDTDFSPGVIKLYDADQIVQMVTSNPNAIAYSSASNVVGKDVKVLRITTVFDDKGARLIDENNLLNISAIRRGEYPLTRYLYFITAGDLTDPVAKFIDFVRGEEGQSVLGESGLVSIY